MKSMVDLLDKSTLPSKTALRARGATFAIRSRRATAVKSSERIELGRFTYDARRRLGLCSKVPNGTWGGYGYVLNRSTVRVDPMGLLDQIFPFDPSIFPTGPITAPAIDPSGVLWWFLHYWDGSSATVDLEEIGLLDVAMSNSYIQHGLRLLEVDAIHAIGLATHSLRCTDFEPRPSVAVTQKLSVPYSFNSWLNHGLFVLGNGSVSMEADCVASLNCVPCSCSCKGVIGSINKLLGGCQDLVTWRCDFTTKFNDSFTDPWDLLDWREGEWNPDGTPYLIVGTDTYFKSGKFTLPCDRKR